MPRLPLDLWTEQFAAPHLPMSAAEMRQRGWHAVDVVFGARVATIGRPGLSWSASGGPGRLVATCDASNEFAHVADRS
jgi:hypothetical protein